MGTRRIRLGFAVGALLALGAFSSSAFAAETIRIGDFELTIPGGFEIKFDSTCAPSGG